MRNVYRKKEIRKNKLKIINFFATCFLDDIYKGEKRREEEENKFNFILN